MRKVAPAPTDDQLAAAEQTENIRRRDREAADADIAEQTRLALAGEPESEAQMAIRAMASVVDSTPARAEENEDEEPPDAPPVRTPTRRNRKATRKPSNASASDGTRDIRDSSRSTALGTTRRAPPPQQEEELDPEAEARKAYRLMDLAYRKWGIAAKKDLRKANRDLAIDLGKDAAIYLRNGVIRMADLHAAIEKLTASKGGDSDSAEEESVEGFNKELENMRAALRGGNGVRQ